jgi:putative transposase
MNKNKSFTAEEKLSIIKEAEEFGIADTMRKYDIPITTYRLWLKKYETDGINGLDLSFKRAATLELKQLKQEQIKLKRLFAEIQEVISRQDEIIKDLTSK